MKREALVVRREGKLVGRVERPEACMQCRACEYGQKAESFVDLPAGDWREGDTVQIDLERGKLSKASLLAYGIPLAGLLIGLAVASLVKASELWQAAAGVAGALAGFGALRLLEPRFRSFRPKASPCGQSEEIPKGESPHV